ncbi:hypothetical protein [Pedobacter steynii]
MRSKEELKNQINITKMLLEDRLGRITMSGNQYDEINQHINKLINIANDLNENRIEDESEKTIVEPTEKKRIRKYIKINTPLQVVGGFAVNESVIIVDKNMMQPFHGLNEIELYKDYDAYNKNHKPIQLINPLPQFELIYEGLNDVDEELTLNSVLSTLKANEYDAEILTTSRIVNLLLKFVDTEM